MKRLFWIALLYALPAAAQDAPSVPQFVDETAASGLQSNYVGEWQYMVGGGVSTFDCNGDALPEMVLAGGESAASLWLNRSVARGSLRFEQAKAGLEQTGVTGSYPLDIDSDGITDLVLLRVGENAVLRGLGNCQFQNANKDWGFAGGDAWSTAMAATWEKGAAWPTIAIGNYIDRAQETFPWGSCTENWLHRPAANGTGFAAPVALKPSFCALSMLFTDWNNTGTPGLRVSNDREYYKGGTEQLWHLEQGQPPALYTEAEGWQRLKIWGMGIATADLDGDGFPEYFLTSMADNKLQTLVKPKDDGALVPKFADIALKRGAIAQRPYTGGDLKPSTAWHAQFGDVNNDGRDDLFVAKGNVSAMPDFARLDPNNLMLQRADGTFEEAGDRAGVASMRMARGAQLVDLNRDGLLDLVVVNRNEPAELWRNSGPSAGHWIELSLHQPGPNSDAIGAKIQLKYGGKQQSREVLVGGGHVSGSIGTQHFGLGAAAEVEVRVLWPDGTEGGWEALASDGFWLVAKDRPAESLAR